MKERVQLYPTYVRKSKADQTVEGISTILSNILKDTATLTNIQDWQIREMKTKLFKPSDTGPHACPLFSSFAFWAVQTFFPNSLILARTVTWIRL